jgi:hypothetical protein
MLRKKYGSCGSSELQLGAAWREATHAIVHPATKTGCHFGMLHHPQLEAVDPA